MDLLAIGTQVTIDGDIPAVIRGITIYSEHWIKYQCIWWDERQRREEWLTEASARRSHKVFDAWIIPQSPLFVRGFFKRSEHLNKIRSA